MAAFKCTICGKDAEAHGIEDLFECGGTALEKEKWDEAAALFNQALKENAEEPRAYFGLLLAECKCSDEDALTKRLSPINEKENYKKAYQFGDSSFRKDLDNFSNQITYNIANQMYNTKVIPSIKNALDSFTSIIGYNDSAEMAEKCKEKIYGYAVEHMEAAKTEKEFLAAKSEFEMVKGYSDADSKAAECAARSDDSTTKNVIYQEALKLGRSDSMIDLKNAIKKLEEIPDYRDAQAKIEIFRKRYQDMTDQSKQGQLQSEIDRQNTLQRMQEEEEKKEARARTMKLIFSAVAAVVIIIVVIIMIMASPKDNSGNDMRHYENIKHIAFDASSEQGQDVFGL